MRSKLMDIMGKRYRFIAQVAREGTRPTGYDDGRTKFIRTLVLKDLERADTGDIVANHMWIDETRMTTMIDMQEGDIIGFDAFVGRYTKATDEQDYGLQHIRNIEILKSNV